MCWGIKVLVRRNTLGITNNKQKMTWLLAAVYIFILVWLILFKMAMPSEIPYLDHIRNINLIPFYYDNETSGHASEVIKNVILFIPLGLYLRIMGLSWRKAIVIGAALSAVLEILQYIFGVGASDITDLITNTLGTAVGVGIHASLSICFKKKEKLNKVLNVIALVCTVLMMGMIAILLVAN